MARLGLTWRPEARTQFVRLADYIGERDKSAALRLAHDIEEAAERAGVFPAAHRVGRVAGAREIVVRSNYLLICRATDTAIDVVAVVHARQTLPLSQPYRFVHKRQIR